MSESPSRAPIDVQEVYEIASLARLELSADEASAMVRDLDRILGYVEALSELDTEGVEPTSHAIPLDTPSRPDVPVQAMDPELALENAPEREGSAFSVPQVVASDEEG